MAPTLLRKGLGHEGIKSVANFSIKYQKICLITLELKKKKKRKKHPKFPLPFFLGSKNEIF
jgi:hypothetical protein